MDIITLGKRTLDGWRYKVVLNSYHEFCDIFWTNNKTTAYDYYKETAEHYGMKVKINLEDVKDCKH